MTLPDRKTPVLHALTDRNSVRRTVLGVAFVIVALFGAFVGLHTMSPSDGARLQPGAQVWRHDGVVVTPLREQPGGLRQGDLVVAVDGRSMETWAQALFTFDVAQPRWEVGQTVIYTVVRDGQRMDVPIQLMRYPLGTVLAHEWGTFLFVLIMLLVTAFVFQRRPNDRAAAVLFLWAVSVTGASTWLFGLQVHDLVGGIGFWLYKITSAGVYILFWITGLHFALIFPQRHPIVVKHAWLIPCLYAIPYMFYVIYILTTRLQSMNTLDWLQRWIVAEGIIAFIYLTLIVTVVIWSYRTSDNPVNRQKIRWVVFAVGISGGGGLLLWELPSVVLGHAIISTNALGLLLLPFPVALAIAILRHRLFDIDVIINRTLVYGTLTVMLALVYVSSVIALQYVFRTLTGQESQLAVVASTLTIAALFSPLRRRIQNVIDRRFYRRKYDAAQVLAAFAATARDEVDLDRLTNELLAVVEETLQPEHVSLWLREPEVKQKG